MSACVITAYSNFTLVLRWSNSSRTSRRPRTRCSKPARATCGQNEILLQRFKLRNRHVVALDEVLILFLPDELAVGKKHGAKLPVLELIAQFVVAGAQAHAVRLGNQRLLIDQLLGSLAGEIRQQHAGLRSAARKLLPDHGPGLTLHLGHGHLSGRQSWPERPPEARQCPGWSRCHRESA
jgi:hypothetical protein